MARWKATSQGAASKAAEAAAEAEAEMEARIGMKDTTTTMRRRRRTSFDGAVEVVEPAAVVEAAAVAVAAIAVMKTGPGCGGGELLQLCQRRTATAVGRQWRLPLIPTMAAEMCTKWSSPL